MNYPKELAEEIKAARNVIQLWIDAEDGREDILQEASDQLYQAIATSSNGTVALHMTKDAAAFLGKGLNLALGIVGTARRMCIPETKHEQN